MYVVRPGDTLFSVAWRHDLDYRSIARWNGIEPPYTIYPNQRLRLRPGAASSQKAASPLPRVTTSAAKPRPLPPRSQPLPSKPQPSLAIAEPIVHAKSDHAKPDSEIVWQWPAQGTIIQRFRPDGPGLKGITLQGRLGEPVRAAAAGRVVYSGNGLRGYGNLIIVKHSGVYLTAYGYNSELLVREGDRVHGGQVIARMGLGPAHQPATHFEIRRNGKPVDPLQYLPPR
ncbi:MAG TPA: peptidoglycan DD-metalloendopeptidase family protein [Nitrococcus sp.]|nr:peptidoglycan DD-metalloendopeptidase family protein [Nitrococcus sp.]